MDCSTIEHESHAWCERGGRRTVLARVVRDGETVERPDADGAAGGRAPLGILGMLRFGRLESFEQLGSVAGGVGHEYLQLAACREVISSIPTT